LDGGGRKVREETDKNSPEGVDEGRERTERDKECESGENETGAMNENGGICGVESREGEGQNDREKEPNGRGERRGLGN
jgi:hypothetical protein